LTNRHNAYPRPGWLNDLAGGLKASDCDNLTPDPSTPSAPSTYGGPCTVQGGWLFRGKSQYYPNMAPAP
jgi:hypothetical protein